MPKLDTGVQFVKGVGEARAKLLAKLGVRTLYDLISYFPRQYEDRTRMSTIRELSPTKSSCFKAVVITPPKTTYSAPNMSVSRLMVSDGTENMVLVFFNAKYSVDRLIVGNTYYFYGQLSQEAKFGCQMVNPVFEAEDSPPELTRRILPIYGLTAGLSNKQLIRAISGGLDACGEQVPDCLPEDMRAHYGLCSARYAYENIHRPTDAKALEKARRRLIFEEFFVFSCGLRLLKEKRTDAAGRRFEKVSLQPFYDALPFTLTGAQSRAIEDAARDMCSGSAMSRLIQGDVGSGKTVVAAAAAYMTFQNGCQAALMVPTEILAEQHFRSLSAMLEPLGMNVVLLTGNMKAAPRRSALDSIAMGSANLVVGTHALITDKVQFADLGLMIADEQHRFGVAQRSALSAKGRLCHVMVMSATPIPRTLALMIYGDLDVSVIDELPPGRQPIDTFLVNESMRERINAFIIKQVKLGGQVYIVCPMVQEGEQENVKAAESYAKKLSTGPLSGLRLGLVHGKLKSADKDKVMQAFTAGELDVLVSTTVIEVGVDVPRACLIVIENAERFGLSQLHQLRGRVGRGSLKSYCVMFSSSTQSETLARLKVMCSTNDGFKISEADLKLRGPGDFFGSRQSGLPAFTIASLADDTDVLYQAREAADRYVAMGGMDDGLLGRIQSLFIDSGNIFN